MKVIVFRFCGGARDGEAIRSDQSSVSENEATSLWKLTWEGTVGRRFDVSQPAKGAYHRYQVKSKYEVDDEVHVICQHVI
jgi:hypothetical protein